MILLKLRELTHKITPADTLLFTALLTVSIVGFFFIKEVMPQGTEVIIEVSGKSAYTLLLSEKTIKEVQGARGITVVEIDNHKVRVTDSPCPDRICVKQGWIDRGAIVCLPNRVIIRIAGSDETRHQLDAVTR